MAAKPYKLTDRRGSNSYQQNTLIEAATQNSDRKSVAQADIDIYRSISNAGRRTLMTFGRSLYFNFAPIRGVVKEQASLAVSTFIPQFYGANQAWGDAAETWLENWHRICDVAGWPYDFRSYLLSQIICPLVDGDVGTLLTETADGYPQIQTIPAHRIGGRSSTQAAVQGGEYDGAKIIDGVIVNDHGRPMAYRVFNDDNSGAFQDISTRDMFLTFDPLFPGQLRGLSTIGLSAYDIQDVKESKEFEKLAQKTLSSKTIMEFNETGDIDAAKAIVSSPATFNADGTKATADLVKLEGGAYHVFKAGTGSKLEAFDWSRPNQNSQAFQETILRDAIKGTDWDTFFSLDPKHVGGAPMRVIVEKINSTLRERRAMVGKPAARVDGYALAKAIKLGLLPEDVDWWKFEHQGPGDVTADRKYDSDVDLQEIGAGISTLSRAIAKRGGYWKDTRKQQDVEVDDLLTRAEIRAKRYGLSIQEAITLYRDVGSYNTLTNSSKATGEAQAQNQEQPKSKE